MTDTRIEPQSWMTAPATCAVLAPLRAGGAGVRFVGGCVRDAVAGRPISDIDLATDVSPERVMELLDAAGLKVIPTGIEHGTVTVVSDGRPYEVTTLRHDIETDGRHAVVAFTDDWEADAARRDFTMNALSLEPDGLLHDPFGGVADLRAGRVRFVGDPRQRIAEDVLRLLRFFRFYAHYGAPPPDPASLGACREMAHLLPRLSAERVRVELLKLLSAPDPASVIRVMRDEGVLDHFLAQATGIDRLARLVDIEAALDLNDPLRRLAAVLPVDGESARHLAQGLRLSNAERDRLVEMVAPPLEISPALGPPARRQLLYRIGESSWIDLVLIAWADGLAAPDDPDWRALLRASEGWRRPEFPLDGRDVKRLGMAEGAVVGELLRAVEVWWIAGDFSAGRKECLAKLRNLARSLS
ncbi:MAG: CCA tRNA nucleotidyltransferase [Rhodospirillales bacterium]|nr:MAG: CCA tRNA nucleotidyltransferase [Rhodospirillales bacterium]